MLVVELRSIMLCVYEYYDFSLYPYPPSIHCGTGSFSLLFACCLGNCMIIILYFFLFSRIILFPRMFVVRLKSKAKSQRRGGRGGGTAKGKLGGIRCVIVVVSQICERIRRNRLTIIFKVPQAKDMKHNRYKITYFNMN